MAAGADVNAKVLVRRGVVWCAPQVHLRGCMACVRACVGGFLCCACVSGVRLWRPPLAVRGVASGSSAAPHGSTASGRARCSMIASRCPSYSLSSAERRNASAIGVAVSASGVRACSLHACPRGGRQRMATCVWAAASWRRDGCGADGRLPLDPAFCRGRVGSAVAARRRREGCRAHAAAALPRRPAPGSAHTRARLHMHPLAVRRVCVSAARFAPFFARLPAPAHAS